MNCYWECSVICSFLFLWLMVCTCRLYQDAESTIFTPRACARGKVISSVVVIVVVVVGTKIA